MVTHQREDEGLRREIPDYSLDRHTRRGTAMGRGLEHWAEEGCQLANEVRGLNRYREQALALRQQYGRVKPRTKGRRPQADPELFDETAGEEVV